MNKLILLLAGLVCAHAAPQFVFVLPPEFLQQMQKPVGEASQSGQQPQIPVFPLESLLGSSSRLAESIVSAPVVPESLQAADQLVEAIPVVEVEQQQTAESSPVVVTAVPPPNAVAEVAQALAMAQGKDPAVEEALVEAVIVEEASTLLEHTPIETIVLEEASPTVVEEAPIKEILVEEAVTVLQEAPIEAGIMEEVITDVQETPVDTPVQEVTSDPTIVIDSVTPVEEISAPSIAEKVTENLVAVEEEVIVQDTNTNTVEEVIIVEEFIPISIVATSQSTITLPSSTVATTSSPVPSITTSPVNQVVDPRMSVDPRFRNYIYVNDAPDVVAAKVALFNLQAASLPKQQLI